MSTAAPHRPIDAALRDEQYGLIPFSVQSPTMRICLVTPAPRGARKGNRVSAERWACFLRGGGHRVVVTTIYDGRPCDVLIALHARKSHRSVRRVRQCCPAARIVVVLTGTDIYDELSRSAAARRSVDWADRLVVLQPRAIAALPREFRAKAAAIIQSAAAPARRSSPDDRRFDVCVLGWMRPVKDPFRAALAARLAPEESRLRVWQAGGAATAAIARRADREMLVNPRYRWLGNLSFRQSAALLARSRLLVLTSRLEGGANVVSEALAAGVPVISSRIDGSIGLLGADYPGYFPVGDTAALARLLRRAEADTDFLATLTERCRRLRPLVAPERECAAWLELVRDLGGK